jgi:hypothetical protein
MIFYEPVQVCITLFNLLVFSDSIIKLHLNMVYINCKFCNLVSAIRLPFGNASIITHMQMLCSLLNGCMLKVTKQIREIVLSIMVYEVYFNIMLTLTI